MEIFRYFVKTALQRVIISCIALKFQIRLTINLLVLHYELLSFQVLSPKDIQPWSYLIDVLVY
jgi:hypothetical protein